MTETLFRRYAETIYTEFLKAVSVAAQEQRVPETAAYEAMRHELRQFLLIRAAEADARTSLWRARVRLYDAKSQGDVIADSDPDLPADAAGADVFSGLPAVAAFLGDLAIGYHAGVIVEGLDAATLAHKLKAFRPTLSRRGGNGTWRVPYATLAPDAPANQMGVRDRRAWIARVDVERVG